MRSNWELTRLETALFIAGVTLIASGCVWAAGIGGRLVLRLPIANPVLGAQ